MTPHKSAAIVAALKRHYGTPKNMMRVLGLDEASPLKEMMAAGEGPYGSDQDASLPGAAEILKLLAHFLDPAAYAQFVKQLLDPTQAADMPPPFPGMPLPGGEKVPTQHAADCAASFADLFPGADRVGLADQYDNARRHAPRQTPSARNASTVKKFDELFPGADKIERAA